MTTDPNDPEQHQRQLAAELATLDFVLPGSLNVTQNRCGKPNCRCHHDPPQLHGPYHSWTRKTAGKTITRHLSAEQANRLRPWIENSHRLRALITELEALCIRKIEHDEGWAK